MAVGPGSPNMMEIEMNTQHTPGDLQVWWCPQVPGKHFTVPVSSVAEGCKILDALADYDLFQLKHRIKPDFANTGGLNVSELDDAGGQEWCSWCDPETGEEDPHEWLRKQSTHTALSAIRHADMSTAELLAVIAGLEVQRDALRAALHDVVFMAGESVTGATNDELQEVIDEGADDELVKQCRVLLSARAVLSAAVEGV